MSLYDGDTERQKAEKRNKMKKIILVAIIGICLMIFALIGIIIFLANQPKSLSLTLDGKKNSELLQLLDIKVDEAGNMEIYAPIKQVAKYFGYDDNNGNYMTASEDTNSCHVKNENEVAIFTLDSNTILKKDLTNDKSNFETYKISEEVFKKNDELYISYEALEIAYNINIFYDAETNTLSIYSLDYYIEMYTTQDETTQTTLIQDLNYSELDETFVNQKALLDDMLVVKDEAGVYSVITPKGDKLLSTQYKSLTYIPENEAFLIQGSDSKYGISSVEEGKVVTKIKPVYNSLQLIDSEKQLYLVSENNKYGVIDINGNKIVHTEYDDIGINISDFPKNNITNGYVLFDTLIPVCQGEKWGFFDINGKQVTDIVYDSVGCITSNTQGTTDNLLLIPEYDMIVIQKEGKYGCMDLTGDEKISPVGSDTFIQTISGENKYFIIIQKNGKDNTMNIVERLESLGITKK